VKLDQAFENALRERNDIVPELAFRIKEAMRLSANILLGSRPDLISIQLTEEQSIYYTLMVEDFRIYVGHYPMSNLEEVDEAVLSIYQGKENILNTSGELGDVIAAANVILSERGIAIPELA